MQSDYVQTKTSYLENKYLFIYQRELITSVRERCVSAINIMIAK